MVQNLCKIHGVTAFRVRHRLKRGSRSLVKECLLCEAERAKAHYQGHKAERSQDNRRRYQENRDAVRARTKTYAARIRYEALQRYSDVEPRCAHCGEDKVESLGLDHIVNNGSDHRRREGLFSGQSTYLWARRNDYPTIFQVLCHNCNIRKQLDRITSISPSAQYRARLKTEVLSHYASPIKCALCKENDLSVMTIDHVNGGGNIHRKTAWGNKSNFYLWFKRNEFPSGFRVLCFNHNLGIRCSGMPTLSSPPLVDPRPPWF
jgi:hypothetical protein